MQSKKKKMGPPKGPRADNVAETRAKILLAAVDHFSRFGFTGAKTEAISRDAGVRSRMIYHYFGGKEGLYVAALDHVLAGLRSAELKVDVKGVKPFDGLLQLFDFIFGHFSSHPELIRMLSAENLLEAKYLGTSAETHQIASPVLDEIRELIERGDADQSIRAGLDPLHLYIVMVGLSYFHISNAHTLGVIWQIDLLNKDWQDEHYRIARDILSSYLAPDISASA